MIKKTPKVIYSNLSNIDNKCSRLEEKTQTPEKIKVIKKIATIEISFYSLIK
jgi:hypothetical protein